MSAYTTKVHTESMFKHAMAEHLAIVNMGHDPEETSWGYFQEEAEGAAAMNAEKKAWAKVVDELLVELKRVGSDLTIRDGMQAFDRHQKRLIKLYK